MTRQKPFLGFALLMVIILVLIVILWSVKRKPDPKFRVSPPDDFVELAASIAGVTHGSVVEGNLVEIIQNGAFFDALFRDIAAAQQSVHFETFLWHEGEIGDQLARHFADAARRGVEVRVLLDASGTRPMKKELRDMMRAAGAKVAIFHAPSFADLGRINNRTHRKLAIMDGRIGYVGGHCIAPEWIGNARNKKEYRDISARVQGPVVNAMQSAFSENWVEETGEVTVGDKYFPRLDPVGPSHAHLVYITPQGNVSAVELLYYLAIISARNRLIIQNPYFLPDPEAVEALAEAVKRGVDVQVMLPSVEATDNALVQHASHHRFGRLLEAGIKIFEYEHTLLHQKVLVVDGAWACIGSTNFDDRSFELNDEVSLAVLDPGIAAQLEATWAADMKHARPVTLSEWKNRGVWHRLKDGVAYLFNEQL
jgi:cardiolipin synthase A/B